MAEFTRDDVQRHLARHAKLYSWRPPTYQYVALASLHELWDPTHRSMLDVGGGTGVMAQAIKSLFALERVVSVDVTNRFLPGLDIETRTFDGRTLPFADASFDCVLLFNVLHHVPRGARPTLLRECRRVVGRGPIYIKDHLANNRADDARLAVLDLMGNLPFKGMVTASYLRADEWQALARDAGCRTHADISAAYRGGMFGALFPNRLELMLRWLPL